MNHDKQLNADHDLISVFCFAGKCTAVMPANTAEVVAPPQHSPLLLEHSAGSLQLKQLFSLLLLSGTGDSSLSSLSGSLGSIKSVNLKQNKIKLQSTSLLSLYMYIFLF